MKLSLKYWTKHKIKAFLIIASIAMCTAALTCMAFLFRSVSAMEYNLYMDTCGDYDAVIPHATDEGLRAVYGCENVEKIGVLYNGGHCRAVNDVECLYGAFEDEQAVKMFHYWPERGGRYPQKSGEITGYKTTFEEMGVAPAAGNIINLEISDSEGNEVFTREFTIVGVLNDQRNQYDDLYREFYEGDYEYPKLFIHKNDLPDNVTMTVILTCKPNVSVDNVVNELRGKSVFAYDSGRLSSMMSRINVMAETGNELNERLRLASKDFYSSKIVPVFCVMVLLLSMISVYAIVSNAMSDRIAQLGIYRCIGLSYSKTMRMMMKETLCFLVAGVVIGYVAGVLQYASIMCVARGCLGIDIPFSFSVEPIVRSETYDPYFYPLAVSFLGCIAAFGITVRRSADPSPVMIMNKRQFSKNKIRRRTESKTRMLLRSITGNCAGKTVYLMLVFTVICSSIFGFLFFKAKASFDNSLFEQRIQEMGLADYDYAAQRDMYDSMWGNVVFNRHNEGMSQQSFESIQNCVQVESAKGIINMPGIKALYDENEISDELREKLAPVNIDNNIQSYLSELNEKTKEFQGYEENNLLYNIPYKAVSNSLWEELGDDVTQGLIDVDKQCSGEEIAIVVYGDSDNNMPYKVGDVITFTDAVIKDEYIEEYDFSSMLMPEGYEPNCYYKYSDDSTEEIPGYAFGEKVVYEAKVGAIIRVTDEKLRSILHSESWVMESNSGTRVDTGYDVLCRTSALKEWKLPDRNYTDVYITLKKYASVTDFERVWYSAIGNSKGMTGTSRLSAKTRLKAAENKNMLIYYVMLYIVLVLGVFGTVNLAILIVRDNIKKISIMRAIGVKKRDISRFYIGISVVVPVVASVLSVIPVWIFDQVKKYAYEYAFSNGHNFAGVREDGKMEYCWQVMFPWYIELWEQPVVAVIVTVTVSAIAISIISHLCAILWLNRYSIADTIKNGDM